MSLVASTSAQQDEIRERIKKLQELFANDPEIARISHRFGEDWSGDDSVFIEIVLTRKTPTAATISRLTREIDAALFSVVRSDELGLYAYPKFVSGTENGL